MFSPGFLETLNPVLQTQVDTPQLPKEVKNILHHYEVLSAEAALVQLGVESVADFKRLTQEVRRLSHVAT